MNCVLLRKYVSSFIDKQLYGLKLIGLYYMHLTILENLPEKKSYDNSV